MAAWQSHPDTFGLSGHTYKEGRTLYPDSNRVFAEIMGSKPVREPGFLVKVGNKMYQLTEAGSHYAAGLQGDDGSTDKVGLRRDTKDEIERLLKAKATDKFRSGRAEDITFHDACGFWKISPRSTAIEFTGQYNNIDRIIAAALAAAQNKGIVLRHGAETITLTDLNGLQELHHVMRDRFAPEIDVILKRTDQR